MRKRFTTFHLVAVASIVSVLGLLSEGSASAQPRWGRPGTPRAGACFFRDVNFQGDYFCAQAGDEIRTLPGRMNDEISSIRTFGGAEVLIYQSDNFGGRSLRFASAVPDLRRQGWNDRLSSIRVGASFGGGREVRNLREADLIIDRAYREVLRREPDPEGRRTYRDRLLNDGWSEERLRDTLRTSNERRDRDDRISRARAEQIVREAYVTVLNREPDPGSAIYVNRIINDGWSQQDVVRALRASEEYRNMQRQR